MQFRLKGKNIYANHLNKYEQYLMNVAVNYKIYVPIWILWPRWTLIRFQVPKTLSNYTLSCYFIRLWILFCWTHTNVLFCATGTPVLDFWWRLLWVFNQSGFFLIHFCGGERIAHSPFVRLSFILLLYGFVFFLILLKLLQLPELSE